MKAHRFLFFLAALSARGDSLTIAGKDLALCGQGSQYQIAGDAPAGDYHWHLERDEAKGPGAIWNGNDRRRSLTLAFAEGPGAYRLWVQAEGGAESNHLDITALAAESLPPLPDDLPRATLVTALPAAQVMEAIELTAAAPSGRLESPRPTTPPGAARSNLGVLKPDAEGVIDLIAAEPAPEIEPIPNPFQARPAGPPASREVSVLVNGVLASGSPAQGCGIINGQLFSVGETVEGFTLAGVAADAIELRNDHATLELPVRDQPTVLRLPR